MNVLTARSVSTGELCLLDSNTYNASEPHFVRIIAGRFTELCVLHKCCRYLVMISKCDKLRIEDSLFHLAVL